MKNIKKLLVFMLIIIPSVAFADVAGPTFGGYYATISNPEGIKCLGWDLEENGRTIAYNETIHIDGEFARDGLDYVFSKATNTEKECYIKVEDIKPVEFKFEPDKYYAVKEDLYVISDKVYLRKGPAQAYKKVMEEAIPKGTILKATYTIDSIWYYVAYEGRAGWIEAEHTDNEALTVNNDISLYKKDGGSVYNFEQGAKLYSDPLYKEELGLEIPAGIKLSFKVYFPYGPYLVTYNNIQGWYDSSQKVEEVNQTILVINPDKMKVYDIPTADGKEIKGLKFEQYKEYDIEYSGYLNNNIVRQIRVNNINYWLVNENDKEQNDYLVNSEDKSLYKLNDDIDIYNDEMLSKKIGTIKKGEYIASYYHIYDDNNNEILYIKGNGWISEANSLEFISPVDNSNYEYLFKNAIGYDNSKKIVENKKEEVKNDKKVDTPKSKTDDNISTRELIIVIIIMVVVLSLTVIVILMLINKKKNQKNMFEEQKNLEMFQKQNVINESTSIANNPVIENPTKKTGDDN